MLTNKNGYWAYSKRVRLADGRTVRIAGRASTYGEALAKFGEHMRDVQANGPRITGRPAAADVPRDCMLGVRVTKHELINLYDAAGDAGLPSAEWARGILLDAAKRAKAKRTSKRRAK